MCVIVFGDGCFLYEFYYEVWLIFVCGVCFEDFCDVWMVYVCEGLVFYFEL